MRTKVVSSLLSLFLLTGCYSTPAGEHEGHSETNHHPAQDSAVSPLPVIDAPPDITIYLGNDKVLDRYEIELYYNALKSYDDYIESYINFLGTQYNLAQHVKNKKCEEAIGSHMFPTKLPRMPSISGLNDEQVVDALTNHIKELRAAIIKSNNEILEKRDKVLDNCHSVIFYPKS